MILDQCIQFGQSQQLLRLHMFVESGWETLGEVTLTEVNYHVASMNGGKTSSVSM